MTAPAYSTLAALKYELRLTTVSPADDTTDYDTRLTQFLLDASRWVEYYTGRRFYGETLTKLYAPDEAGSIVHIDDAVSVTLVEVTYTGHWDAAISLTSGTDYTLYPFNASQVGQPYRAIVRDPIYSRYAFPVLLAGSGSPLGTRAGLRIPWPTVRVTGSFGYSASAPEQVAVATRRIAMRMFKMADAPFGIVESASDQAMPMRIQADSEVVSLLQPFRRKFII